MDLHQDSDVLYPVLTFIVSVRYHINTVAPLVKLACDIVLVEIRDFGHCQTADSTVNATSIFWGYCPFKVVLVRIPCINYMLNLYMIYDWKKRVLAHV